MGREVFVNRLRRVKKKFPLLGEMYDAIKKLIYLSRALSYSFWYWLFPSRFVGNEESTIIVSITSFPQRVDSVWITLESLKRQREVPRKIVLVLAEEEFPGRTLPKSLHKQINLGIDVLWTQDNIRSFKKLIPVKKHFPTFTIVTFDDDVIYESWRLRKLVEASRLNPESIVGHRGRLINKHDDCLLPYLDWKLIKESSNGILCFLTGVGGVLYPPHLLDENLLLDMDVALKLCPNADDVWIWAVSHLSSVSCMCLGNNSSLAVYQSLKSPTLYQINGIGGHNDVQLKAVMDYFLIDI